MNNEQIKVLLQRIVRLEKQLKYAILVLDRLTHYISDCTYIKEPDYTNVTNFIQ